MKIKEQRAKYTVPPRHEENVGWVPPFGDKRPKAVTHQDEKQGWRVATLGEFVATKTRGIVPNKTPGTTFELYSVPSLDTGAPEIVRGEEIGSNKQIVDEGTVLLCKINPRINRSWVVSPHTAHQKIASTEWITFPHNEAFEPKYLAYYLKQDAVRDFLAANASGVGGSLMRVKPATLKDYPFPLAPLDQQKHIVAEIEKQFSRLDEAVANLKRVKANLKRYKAAVLKAAVEGRLVETEAELVEAASRRLSQREDAASTYETGEQLDAQGRANAASAGSAGAALQYETGEQLLKRILETRRTQWKGKGKYKEPVAPDTTNLPELPEGWVWASVDQLLMSLRNGLSKKPEDSEPGIPILRISAVRPLELVTKDSRFYRLKANERVDDYKLEMGDVLFVRYNGTKELVGVCALVNAVSGALLYPDKLIRGRVVSEQHVLPSYLAIAANVGKSRQHIDELIKTTAGQQGIAGGEIKQMPLPLPPYAEQLRIVVEVDRRLSLIRETEAQAGSNFQRSERLRQSILRGLFSPAVKSKSISPNIGAPSKQTGESHEAN